MFLIDIEVFKLLYTCVYLVAVGISYMCVVKMRIESLFRQGSVREIRIFQIILSMIIAYFITEAIVNLAESFNFIS